MDTTGIIRVPRIIADFDSAGSLAPTVLTPREIFGSSNIIAWYQGDKDVYTDTAGTSPASNGNSVSLWKDQSGNGFHQFSADNIGLGNQPTYNTSSVNGKPGIDMVAANQQYLVNAPSVIGGVNGFQWQSSNPNFGVFIAFHLRSPAYPLNGVLCSFSATGNDANAPDGMVIAVLFGNGSTAVQLGEVYNNANYQPGSSVSAGDYAYSTTSDGTNLVAYSSNSQIQTNTVTVTLAQVASYFSIGNSRWDHDPSSNVDGMVAEVVVVQKTVSSTERSQMQTYFSTTRGYGV